MFYNPVRHKNTGHFTRLPWLLCDPDMKTSHFNQYIRYKEASFQVLMLGSPGHVPGHVGVLIELTVEPETHCARSPDRIQRHGLCVQCVR